MIAWIILTIMTSVATVLLAVPVIRRHVENDLRRKVHNDERPETADTVVKRHVSIAAGPWTYAALFGVGIVVLGFLGLYAIDGNLDLLSASNPDIARQDSTGYSRDLSALEAFAAALKPSGIQDEGDLRPQNGLPPVDEMIQRLAARLVRNPEDIEGWRTLGWAYLSTGRFREAVDAYAKAIAINPDIAEFRAGRMEGLVRAAGDIVTSEAKTAIAQTLKLDPQNGQARFFAALAKEQEGDKRAALADWTALLKDANSDDPWVSDLKSRISELEAEISSRPPTVPAEPTRTIAGEAPGTSSARLESQTPLALGQRSTPEPVHTEAMPSADRSDMIRGMVDGLAHRLEQSPHDADGWIRLIRSRVVLGESELAKQALTRGISAFSENPSERERIVSAARQLGLNQ